ncbi:membrane-targeted effector domain-containing toxin [Legionella sp. D16C41]|uniref:membrane-targeted effector domain-containing toxin n=1 Tax=Legionella sp. D16C41 TaxID=3402688 RepID=UPI003AF9CF51
MAYHPVSYSFPSFDQTKDNRYKKFVREITGNPENFRPEPFEKKLNTFYPACEVSTPITVETLLDLFQTNFIVAENHLDRASKNFLIKIMAKLKAAGFTTLFLEHLYYDDQEELDDYDPTSLSKAEVNKKVENRLANLDNEFWISAKGKREHNSDCHCEKCYLAGNNFSELVKTAKQYGIRIVGIDTEYTYSEQYNDNHMEYAYGGPTGILKDKFRLKSMNYTAAKIIEKEVKEHPGKWFALMGCLHCYSAEDFSGVPQLTGAKTVLVDSESNLNEIKLSFNGACEVKVKKSFWNNDKKIIQVPYAIKIEVPKNQSIAAIAGMISGQKVQPEVIDYTVVDNKNEEYKKFNNDKDNVKAADTPNTSDILAAVSKRLLSLQEAEPEVTIDAENVNGQNKEKDNKQELLKEFQRRTQAQIKRLDTLPKLSNNPAALQKKRILESAKTILENKNLSFNDRFTKLREIIQHHQAILTKPHSSIPQDILKGLLVFVASICFFIPGVLLGIHFFSPKRLTTTEEQIVKPLNEFK